VTTEKLQTKTGPLVFVGIPAFNVEESIAKVVVNAKKHCDEIVVCDDGSSDDTGEIARKLGCRVIRHPKNRGYGSAIRSLLDAARESGADILVTIDGDGQHNSKEISGLVAPIMKGEADVVIGTRFGPNSDGGNIPSTRRLGIKAITWLVDSLTDQQITDAQSGFRAYNKRALEALHPGEQGMGASTEILFGARTNGLRFWRFRL